MVELVLAKDWVRVRFPAPAQITKNTRNSSVFCYLCGRESNFICFHPEIEKVLPYF